MRWWQWDRRDNLVNIASPGFKANPFPFYARLRAEAPAYRMTLPTRETAWLITRYDDVAMVLKDERFVKDMNNALTQGQVARLRWFRKVFKTLKRNMLNLDPPDHTRLRGLMKVFSPRLIEQMHGRYIRKIIRTRRADPHDDLVSALVQAEEAGDTLSEEELLAMVFLLLAAGHETTVNLIGNGTLALLEHPDQMDKLRNAPALIKPAVEELLRYTSPVEIATERDARGCDDSRRDDPARGDGLRGDRLGQPG